MSDLNIELNAGACKFITKIDAKCEDGMTVQLNIESTCPNVKELAKNIKGMDVMEAITTPIMDNPMYKQCSEYIIHAACPVPMALVKACEAAGDLCLKKDVTMKYV